MHKHWLEEFLADLVAYNKYGDYLICSSAAKQTRWLAG